MKWILSLVNWRPSEFLLEGLPIGALFPFRTKSCSGHGTQAEVVSFIYIYIYRWAEFRRNRKVVPSHPDKMIKPRLCQSINRKAGIVITVVSAFFLTRAGLGNPEFARGQTATAGEGCRRPPTPPRTTLDSAPDP